ncbi:SDR family NAD(P)-dependent oxidoreductase [Granulicoccus phenolivorans]|uniref:SDR family NAD(P)-dependent oxidoreductase n=1 Tax=Granulicoccus phenolivorans TaxID=266854 RepID=UPI00041440DC|nr:SDR family oxidoreductase [Granulicoccus phenolivorans]
MSNKVVIITGAAQGIGLAAARRFAEGGYSVAMTDLKVDELNAAVAQLQSEGFEVSGHELDVANHAQGAQVVAEIIAHYGRLDALFNNAGITGHRKNVLNFDPEEIKQAEEVNLWGSLYMIQHVARYWVENKIEGAVVNVSSFVASFAEWSPFAYGISKTSVDGLTRTAAFQLGKYGIRVNSVAPGYTKTEMAIKYDYSDPKLRKAAEDKSLLNRWIEPREIANAAFFLAGDQASAITGVKLPVDAGYTTTKEDNKVSLYGENE